MFFFKNIMNAKIEKVNAVYICVAGVCMMWPENSIK